MINAIIWDCNPTAFDLFGLEVRWYGVFFALAFLFGYYIMIKMVKRDGNPPALADSLLYCVAIAVVVGARLGHCLFYEPGYYLSNPIAILNIRDGGLASHGAAIAIIVGLFWVKYKYKLSIWYLLDKVVIVVALSGFFIRMGNLFNSEIYGVATDLPWGFIFVNNGETIARHPTQIYEALSYLILFIGLIAYYLKAQTKPREGVLFGIFLVGCFGMRFLIEFVKEVQVSWETAYVLNNGQMLSIPFVIAGIIILYLSYKGKLEKRSPDNKIKN